MTEYIGKSSNDIVDSLLESNNKLSSIDLDSLLEDFPDDEEVVKTIFSIQKDIEGLQVTIEAVLTRTEDSGKLDLRVKTELRNIRKGLKNISRKLAVLLKSRNLRGK